MTRRSGSRGSSSSRRSPASRRLGGRHASHGLPPPPSSATTDGSTPFSRRQKTNACISSRSCASRSPDSASDLPSSARRSVFFRRSSPPTSQARTCHRRVDTSRARAVRARTHALGDIARRASDASAWAEAPAPKLAIQMAVHTTRHVLATSHRGAGADEARLTSAGRTTRGAEHGEGSLANPFQTGHTTLPKNFVEPPGFSPFHRAAERRKGRRGAPREIRVNQSGIVPAKARGVSSRATFRYTARSSPAS